MEKHTHKKNGTEFMVKHFQEKLLHRSNCLWKFLYKYRKIDNDSTFAAISHTNNRNEISLKIIQNTK